MHIEVSVIVAKSNVRCVQVYARLQQLRRWADVVLVAPLSANTLAKLSNGICDNLLTCLMRALDVKRTEVLVCPAMNTHMWDHPFTLRQLDILKTLDYQVVGPIGKLLACGDLGERIITV